MRPWIVAGLLAGLVMVSAALAKSEYELMVARADLARTKADVTDASRLEHRLREHMSAMAPRSEIDDAIAAQRSRANTAQQAIVDEYVKVYCADHSEESPEQKQMTMYEASELSKLSMAAGVDRLALAEYRKCQRSPAAAADRLTAAPRR